MSPALASFSRNSQSVVASGMLSSIPSRKNRVNDSRSRTWYSACSSERLLSACKTSIRNITIASSGFLPALLFLISSGVSTTASISTRKLSHGTSRSIASSGSPFADSAASRLSASKNPSCPILASANHRRHERDSHRSAAGAIFRGALENLRLDVGQPHLPAVVLPREHPHRQFDADPSIRLHQGGT